jgi:hypothetical protein
LEFSLPADWALQYDITSVYVTCYLYNIQEGKEIFACHGKSSLIKVGFVGPVTMIEEKQSDLICAIKNILQ